MIIVEKDISAPIENLEEIREMIKEIRNQLIKKKIVIGKKEIIFFCKLLKEELMYLLDEPPLCTSGIRTINISNVSKIEDWEKIVEQIKKSLNEKEWNQ